MDLRERDADEEPAGGALSRFRNTDVIPQQPEMGEESFYVCYLAG